MTKKQMAYEPQTQFCMEADGSIVYNLKRDDLNHGEPRMVHDVSIFINAPPEYRVRIARTIMRELNGRYKTNEELGVRSERKT